MTVDDQRALPSGLVTFLITDVEGSTRTFQRLGHEYPVLLSEAQRVVRDVVERFGGVVVKDTGDGIMAAFPDPAAGCEAALHAQLALARAHDAAGGLRVRMGLHTGSAEPTGRDYVALPVHQAARIADAGHGGQILLSEATAGLVDSRIAGANLTDLGEHWLKDFGPPIRLFQLVHPDLPSRFPALRSPAAENTALPIARTSFVGRDDELSTLRDLLEQSRLVTITGLGGSGKTRLALRAAAELNAAFPDGTWLIPLSGAAREDLATAVASALGVAEDPGQPPEEAVLGHLRPRRALLIVDAVEEVLESARDLLPTLVTQCPGVTVFATSRVPLAVPPEIAWPLPAMDVPDETDMDPAALLGNESARLLIARGAAVRPGFAATRANAAAIVRICRRLGGLPLAIELAAARLKVLTPDALASRLDERLGVLGSQPDGRGGARALESIIDWTWRLLTPGEQVLYRRLSVFVGGASLEAVEATCVGGDITKDNVLDDLVRLVDKALIVYDERDGESRYRMLDPVREDAQERLVQSGEQDEVVGRFLSWCATFTQELSYADERPDYELWVQRADAEVDNIRTALDLAAARGDAPLLAALAGAMSGYWPLRGRFELARTWLHRAVEMMKAQGLFRTALWTPAAYIELAFGHMDAAETMFREVVDGAPPGDTWLPSSLLGLGTICRLRGDLATARAFAEDALRRAQGFADGHVDEVNAIADLAAIDWIQGDLATARSQYRLVRQMCLDSGDHRRATNSLLNEAGVAVDAGADDALAVSLEAVAACRRFADRDSLGYALQTLGALHVNEGRADDAKVVLEEAVTVMREVGVASTTALVLGPLAHARLDTGDRRGAYDACAEGLQLLDRSSDKMPAVELLHALGRLWVDARPELALGLAAGACAVANELQATLAPASASAIHDLTARARAQLDESEADALWAARADGAVGDTVTWALSLPAPVGATNR